jgi:multicomponent Na+:H+ antiporter subunit D
MMVLTEWLVVLPVVAVLSGAALGAMFWGKTRLQAVAGVIAVIVHLIFSVMLAQEVWTNGPVMMAMSNWVPPFGIIFVADLFSAGLLVMTGLLGLVIAVYALATVDEDSLSFGFFPLFCGILFGVSGAFLTGDIFNLYVWLEVMLISSFGLFVLGGTKEQIDGTVKYAAVNLLATTFFLIAVAYLYGTLGTLNMADLSLLIAERGFDAQLTVIAALFVLALGMKAAAFPLFFWLPASYHTPYPVVSALFSALLTKVGVYALIRVFTLIFPITGSFADAFTVIAGLTMVFGAAGALAQTDMRRMVAFLVVSGIGFMLMGLGIGGEEALLGSLIYIVHSMIISAALFMAVGLARQITGASTIGAMAGIYRTAPVFSFLVLAVALSMAGSPPFSGLWAKIILVKAGLDVQNIWAVTAILVAGFLSLMALGRAFALAIWMDTPNKPAPAGRPAFAAMGAFGLLAILSAAIGLWPAPLVDYAQKATAGLKDPSAYLAVVCPASGDPEAAPARCVFGGENRK